MKPKKTNRSALALAALAAMVFATTGASADGQEDEAGFPRILTSTLARIDLPEGARRAVRAEDLEKFESALKRVAEINHGKTTRSEVLVWAGKEAMKALPERMKQAGYSYTIQPPFTSEAGKVTPVAAVAKEPREKRTDLLGMWIEKDGLTLLIWGHYTADNPAKPGHVPDPRLSNAAAGGDLDRKETESPATKAGGTPADLLGAWSWTTIGSIAYRDTVTRQLDSPSGMSAKFTFTRDGRYKKFFYVRQQTYSLVTESTTNEEGAVTFNSDGTFITKPIKGHYNGHTGTRIIDRDMTEAERKPATWYWEWKTADEKRQLYLGPTKDAVKPFKPAE